MKIRFRLNGTEFTYRGDGERSLLDVLRNKAKINSVKDGCSGQAACGACLVEIDGKARLSCTLRIKTLEGAEIATSEGIPASVLHVIASAFVETGAVQCGFCTPGLVMRTKILFQERRVTTKEEIRKAIKAHFCRCTGYVKIVDAIEQALRDLNNPDQRIIKPEENSRSACSTQSGVGQSLPKYGAYETALGRRKFAGDLRFPGMLYGALRFSDHPRARVISIDTTAARAVKGVRRVFTAADVPGDRFTGLIFSDWPLMVAPGEITAYIGDVIAGVVALNEETARKAAKMIRVEYEILEPVTEVHRALAEDSPRVHAESPNLLETCRVKRGDGWETAVQRSKYIASGIYETQRIEHAFLETEAAIAIPEAGGIHLYSQGQGIYVDQRQVASLLGLDEELVRVTLVPCGGGFGGREDMTIQGHASLFARLLDLPVRVRLSREESIRMHPKRHPVTMDISLACDETGMLTAIKMKAFGDTGAYASVGTKVMERVAGHATGGYYIPAVDLESLTVYTNNIPSGAMRGFGVNQVNFSLESCIDDLCEQGSFDRWKFRYQNALDTGKMTATGQVLGEGVGVKACLLALKDYYYASKFAGLACGIKNSGVGNGMTDFSEVRITIQKTGRVLIEHGWTEMGQGIQNMAIQTLCQETGISPDVVDVEIDTRSNLLTGMTTSSRATALLGNAIIDAAEGFRQDLDQYTVACIDLRGEKLIRVLQNLAGNSYHGKYYCDWTTKPGTGVKNVVTHYSYGYAAQLVVLDDTGEISKVYAAHDAGKIMNPVLFQGQIEGAVHMGLGYALTEDLPMENGRLLSDKLNDCGVLRADKTPEIVVIGIEERDPVGPYGAKGIGEIGLVPTAAAVANALYQFDGIRRTKLPMKRK